LGQDHNWRGKCGEKKWHMANRRDWNFGCRSKNTHSLESWELLKKVVQVDIISSNHSTQANKAFQTSA